LRDEPRRLKGGPGRPKIPPLADLIAARAAQFAGSPA
jgi:hypothetical protein